jgi:hypothetical protein
VPDAGRIRSAVERVVSANTWNRRVALVRAIPEDFGKAHLQQVYAAIAEAIYVPKLAPDFAYVHWRDDYELAVVQRAYDAAHALTSGFGKVDAESLTVAIESAPTTLRIFRLLTGLTTQEFAATTSMIAPTIGGDALSNSAIKAIENGGATSRPAARVAASVVDLILRGEIYKARAGSLRSRTQKPDTANGWETVRTYAKDGVPFPVFLHQRYYGGAFRQILDATSGKRGGLLEDAVAALFASAGVGFVRTGPSTQKVISSRFGLTVRPAPDFVIHDQSGTLRAILECKQANDGGTARDKAARYSALRSEAMRLGGVPVFAVLAGLGWRRTADTLGPVIRDTDGRVFTMQTLPEMMTVEPLSTLAARVHDRSR